MLALNDIADMDRFCADCAERYIDVRVDAKTGLAVCCYTQRTQVEGHWDDASTMVARGLVVRPDPARLASVRQTGTLVDGSVADYMRLLDGIGVVARGMRKFFTVEAAQSDWGAIRLVDDGEDGEVIVANDVPLDMDRPASVSDKVDGALGIGVPVTDSDGTVSYVLSTKGSLGSDEARFGTAHLRRDEARMDMLVTLMTPHMRRFSPIFEIVTPEVRHVVDYGDFDDSVFLGLEEMATGRWIPAALLGADPATADTGLEQLCGIGFHVPEVQAASTLREAITSKERDNREGMVVTIDRNDGSQAMYKVKYETFLTLQAIHHMNRQGLRTLAANLPIDAIFAGTGQSSLVAAIEGEVTDMAHGHDVPETVAAMVADRLLREYVTPIRELHDGAAAWYPRLLAETGENDGSREWRKGYAAAVNAHAASGDFSPDVSSLLFRLPQVPVSDVGDAIRKYARSMVDKNPKKYR